MGIRENTIIKKICTYDLPDDYLHQTNSLGKTGTFEYEGPNKLWIFVKEDTGTPNSGLVYTEKDDGAEVPTPPGLVKVLVDAEIEPVMASMIWRNRDYSYLPTVTENLPDGSTYTRPEVQPPDHTYEFMECVYDIDKQDWVKPFPWKKPHITWEELRAARVSLLNESDKVLATKILTDEQKQQYEVYRQKLRDLPATFAGIDPWKIPFPVDPLLGGN